MKWTVLSDNRSGDGHLPTEHGLSILLETARHRILLDTGASDLFVRNAEVLGIDLSTVDYVFISHGHSDHAGGLQHFMTRNNRAKIIVSPHALNGKFFSKRGRLHSLTPEWPAMAEGKILKVDETCKIDDGLYVIAQITHHHPMPKGNCHLYAEDADGNLVNDDFRHELALYADGLLFTGCAHSGLENILTACPWPVHTVLGGFHLLDGVVSRTSQTPTGSSSYAPPLGESEEELTAMAERLKANYPAIRFYTSHCTGDSVFDILKATMKDQLLRFNCGMSINNNY